MQSVTTRTARRYFARLLEEVHYSDTAVQIRRDKRPMAWLIGEPLVVKINMLLEFITENEPALADTLAISLNPELMQAIREGDKDVEAGRTIPLEDVLKD